MGRSRREVNADDKAGEYRQGEQGTKHKPQVGLAL